MDVSLDDSGIAESLYKAVSIAQGNEPNWDGLGLEDQMMYLRVAKKGPLVAQDMVGESWQDVAYEMYRLSSGQDVEDQQLSMTWANMAPVGRLVWEIIARHLIMLLDADDLVLGQAEAMWQPWLAKRLENETKA